MRETYSPELVEAEVRERAAFNSERLARLVALYKQDFPRFRVPGGEDGDQNEGFSLNRITGIVGGLQVPIYSIAYNYHNTGDLDTLSKINEATTIKADTDDVVNQLRNLFNVQM